MTEALFQIHGLTKTYRTSDVEVRALRGVDATLEAGEMAVMLGPSGSGKSTFLNIIGGLDTPNLRRGPVPRPRPRSPLASAS